MLNDLKILNGELSPKYDINNNKYTVKIDSEVKKLNISYPVEKDKEVHIFGNNNLKEGENYIVISIKQDDKINYIYLNVIKEESKSVFGVTSSDSSLDVSNSTPVYGGPLILLSVILLIVTLFLLIFGKKSIH